MQINKIVRTNDPVTSHEAAIKVSTKLTKLREMVLKMIQDSGSYGITSKEMIRRHPEMSSSSISSRPNELEKMGLIFHLGDKRDGARVIRAVQYKTVKENENGQLALDV